MIRIGTMHMKLVAKLTGSSFVHMTFCWQNNWVCSSSAGSTEAEKDG